MTADVKRTDLYVGLFLVATAALVVIALLATSGWGVAHYDVFVRTDNAQDITADTKIYMQGLEVGRVAGIAPRPVGAAGQLEFILRFSLVDRFPDGTPLRLPTATTAEVTAGLLGGTQVQLTVQADTGGTLAPGDTIDMRRGTSPLEAFGALARDLKGTIEQALVSATGTFNMVRTLADSLRRATGTARRALVATQPGFEKVLAGVSASLDRLQLVLDSANVRTGITLGEVNAAVAQGRVLMANVDTLTRLLVAMGGENRPDINRIIVNFRDISKQLGYVLEQLSRRPLRFITGVKIPDSLTSEGRRNTAADSAHRAPTPPPAPDTTPPRPTP
jgi:ABC-type transporter Mla subunit MlaD